MPIATERSPEDEGTGVLEALWRYKFLAVAIVVVFLALGLLTSYPDAGIHTGTVLVALKDPRGSLNLLGSGVSSSDLPRYTSLRSDFARTQASMELAAKYAKTTPGTLRSHVSVVPDPTTDVFRIVATDESGPKAELYAQSVSKAYRELSRQSYVAQLAAATGVLDAKKPALIAITTSPNQPRANAAAASLTQLEERQAQLAETAALFGDGIEYTDKRPLRSAGTSGAMRTGIIGLVFGLLIATLVAWFLAARRPLADDPDQVANVIDAPFLGEVNPPPSNRRLGAAFTARDGYDIVSTTVSTLVTEGVLLVVSPTSAPGRSETALHAALAVVREGRKVLIVDADNDRRTLTRTLGLVDRSGLVDVLKGTASATGAAGRVGIENVELHALGSGPQVDNVATLYQSQNAVEFLANARKAYEMVIVDCPPLLASASASALARGADRVLLVVEAGTTLSIVKRAHQQLALFGLPVVGYVFARRSSSSGGTSAAIR